MLKRIRTILLQVINKLSKGNLSYERFLSGIDYEKRGKYDKAIEELSNVLQMDPHNNYAANWLAYSFLKIGENDKAFNTLSKASAPVKDMDETWYNIGNSYQEEKKIDRAILCYERALYINPRNADALINLGLIYDENKGSLEKALELYKEAFKITANDFMLLSNMGSVLNRLGISKEAISHYERAIELAPHDFKLFLNLGIAQFNEGLFVEAEKSFKKLFHWMEKMPRFITVWENYIWRWVLSKKVFFSWKRLHREVMIKQKRNCWNLDNCFRHYHGKFQVIIMATEKVEGNMTRMNLHFDR